MRRRVIVAAAAAIVVAIGAGIGVVLMPQGGTSPSAGSAPRTAESGAAPQGAEAGSASPTASGRHTGGPATAAATGAGKTAQTAEAGSPKPANAQAGSSKPAPDAPSFDVVKVAPDGSAVIAGRAAPDSTVTVLENNKSLGAVTADNRGEWVLIPDTTIKPGERQLSLQAKNPRTGATVDSNSTVALSIAPPQAAPGTAGSSGESTLAVIVPKDAGEPVRPLQVPQAATQTPAASGQNATGQSAPLSVGIAQYDAQGRLVLSGHAAPGATLRLYAGNKPLGTATANASGAWSQTTPRAPIPNGRSELRVDRLTPQGTVAQRLTVPLAPIALAALPENRRYRVERGNNLWMIARRTYGNGLNYTIIYAANAGHIRDPDLIYPGQIFALPRS